MGGGKAAAAHPRGTAVEIAVLVIAAVSAVAAARVAQVLLVPILTGIVLSYTLRPLVSALERIRLPRAVGAAVAIAVVVSVVSTAAYAIRDDVNAAIAELPAAARKLRQATAESVRQAPHGPISNVKAAAAELDKAAAEATGKPNATVVAPVDAATPIQTFVTRQSAEVLTVLAQIFVALLLAFFLLVAGDTFRRRVAKVAGASLTRRRVTIEVLDAIDAQIQAYIVTLLLTNVVIAFATWAGLWLLGVPNASMWGAATGVLHVVPYAGTAISAFAVGVAAFVATGGIADAFAAGALIVGIAALFGMGLATWMQGRAARMNPVAVFIGVLFFGWLWGGWGLLLGMPLMAVLKSITDRTEALRPLSELLRA